jgi:predicted nucleic-acid-binding protein
VLRTLLGTEGVTVEGEFLVLSALAAFETEAADLADYLILATARRAQALPLWTFDERLMQTEGVERVP